EVDINSPTNYLDNISLALNNGTGAPVPEPATVLLLGIGLLGLAGYSKKKFKKR
ncbi:MAG: PEP-CTERM sorting domain-containing protein, partial [Deltaproteobacteria bacterium]